MAKKPTVVSFKDRFTKVFNTIKTDTFHAGFTKVDLWTSTGVYALNRMLSNRYDRSFLYGRTITIYGESGSGKSLLLAQSAGIEQRERNTFVIWVDVEHATDDEAGQKWFRDAGLNIDGNFQYINLATINEAQKLISDFVKQYRKDVEAAKEGNGDMPPPVIFCFDSYSALLTESQHQNALKGEVKGDQGQKAKQLGEFILRTNHLLNGLPILVAGVMHVYQSQEEYGDRHKTTGGMKVVYMSSQALLLTMKRLKAGETNTISQKGLSDDDKKQVVGIISVAKVLKSRFSKPFEQVEIQIPYGTGIDPYSGLFELFVLDGIITSPTQGWYQFTRSDGTVVKFQKSSFRKYVDEMMAIPIKSDGAVGVDLAPTELQAEIEAAESSAAEE